MTHKADGSVYEGEHFGGGVESISRGVVTSSEFFSLLIHTNKYSSNIHAIGQMLRRNKPPLPLTGGLFVDVAWM